MKSGPTGSKAIAKGAAAGPPGRRPAGTCARGPWEAPARPPRSGAAPRSALPGALRAAMAAALYCALALGVLAPRAVAAPASPLERRGSAEVCPWCREDPDVMAAAGVVSHGPIPIGRKDSEALADELAGDWIFLETAHLRWASSMGPAAVDARDRERVEAELDRLRALLPDVPKKVRRLDPWLRLHLLAMRGEEFYARFQDLLGVTDADFPAERSAEGPFMGAGRFLGEKDKFEVVIHRTRSTHYAFTEGATGIRVTDSFRWHFPGDHKLLVSVPAEDADLREDRWLFPHVVHNLSHVFLCAYKHFSFDPPIWLDEGLAHAMEKEVEPESNTTDGEEGTMRERHGPSDWRESARRLVARGKQPSFAQLLHAKSFGELDLDANVAAWGVVRFLADEHPDRFARFVGGVKGQLDERGYPSGADLQGLQRRLLQELWGWSPADLDQAWTAWAARTE